MWNAQVDPHDERAMADAWLSALAVLSQRRSQSREIVVDRVGIRYVFRESDRFEFLPE